MEYRLVDSRLDDPSIVAQDEGALSPHVETQFASERKTDYVSVAEVF